VYPTTDSQNTNSTEHNNEEHSSLGDILTAEEYLCDLHTHLLGMGNTGFWLDSIIDNRNILPENDMFCKHYELRKQLCPLIWSEDQRGFIDGEQTAKLFQLLIEHNFPNCNFSNILEENFNGPNFDLIRRFTEITKNDEKLLKQLKHYGLSFGKAKPEGKAKNENGRVKHKILGDFTYDVVLTLDDLGKALGVTSSCECKCNVKSEDLIQSKVEEKLGLHIYQKSVERQPTEQKPTEQLSRPVFRRWIIFNAREQKFDVVKGITVEILRKLITVDPNKFEQTCALARAHIRNAFSMCNPDGTDPRPIDFDRFHGSFTPEFYPRRFKLKDSLYSQRLDILAALLIHILRNYQTCLPPIRYCELSLGVRDICRACILDVLCSFPPSDQSITKESIKPEKTSFRTMIEKGHFPHLRNACARAELPCTPNVVYKFLAGFDRQDVKAHRLENRSEAFQLLNDAPDVAIHYMLSAIVQSENDEKLTSNNNKQSSEPHTTAEVNYRTKLIGLFDNFMLCLINFEKQKIENQVIRHKILISIFSQIFPEHIL
jgi:hypothetical protein